MAEVLEGYTSPGIIRDLLLYERAEAYRNRYVPWIRDQRLIQEGDNVLELGSGMGHKTQVSVEEFKGAVFRGLEINPDMLNIARNRIFSVNFQQGDMTKKEDYPEDFNVVQLNQSAHHLNISERGEMGDAIHSKLPKDGRIIVIDTFNMPDFIQRAYGVFSQHPSNKVLRILHAGVSVACPSKYPSDDYGYHQPEKSNILGPEQDDMFDLIGEVNPYGRFGISEILAFKKR